MKPGWQICSGVPRYMLAIAAALTGLTGCVSEMSIARPRPLPTAFPGNGAARTALSSWWRAFGSGELNALMERPAVANLDVRAALARIERAEAQARAIGAQRFPFVAASFGGSRSQASGTTGGQVNPPSRSNFVSGALAASFELDIWGRNRDQCALRWPRRPPRGSIATPSCCQPKEPWSTHGCKRAQRKTDW